MEKLDVKQVKTQINIERRVLLRAMGPNEVSLRPEGLYWFSRLSPPLSCLHSQVHTHTSAVRVGPYEIGV